MTRNDVLQMQRAIAAEAQLSALRSRCEGLAVRYSRIADEHQHSADLVGEGSNVYRIHANLAGSYRERAVDVRELLSAGGSDSD
jgi:hypothetical protein